MGTEVRIPHPKACDFCLMRGERTDAVVDGKTTQGPWANMCQADYEIHGVGLGTGKGQRLIVVKVDDDEG